MKKIIYCLLLFTIVSFDIDPIKVISITYSMTSTLEEDSYFSPDTLHVYLLGQERIYKMPRIINGNTNKRIINSESYFICTEGKLTGTYYKSNLGFNKNLNDTLFYTKLNGLNVDSFLAIHAF